MSLQAELSDMKLTDEQLSAVEALRGKVEAKNVNDSYPLNNRELARFLKVNYWNVDTAEEKYHAMLAWRAEKKLENVLDTPYENKTTIETLVPHAYHGFDLAGRPIYFEKTGAIHCAALVKHVTEDQFAMSHIYGMERISKLCKEQSEKEGKVIDEFITVLDLKGLSMSHSSAISFLRLCAPIDTNYYPGRVAKILIVNAPWVMPMLYKLVSVFLDQSIKDSIVVLSGDPATELLKHISKENLPSEYGGECKCDGGCVPQPDATELIESEPDDGFKRHNVAAGATWEEDIQVEEKGTIVSWHWESAGDYDIDFEVSLKMADGAVMPLIPKKRSVKGEGSYTADDACTVVFKWDNAFSYWTSKDLKFGLYKTTDSTDVDHLADVIENTHV